MRLEELKEGEVFRYDGSTYAKSVDDDGVCFMVVGMVQNNRSREITLETEVDGTGIKVAEFLAQNGKGRR